MSDDTSAGESERLEDGPGRNADSVPSNDKELKKIDREQQQTIDSAHELLTTLEYAHRNDLPLHLYSSFLLKKLLCRANERKHAYEVNKFIQHNIKDSWVSWPNENTAINPQTDTIYEDTPTKRGGSNQPAGAVVDDPIRPGEVSERALRHAARLLNIEMNAVWQQGLSRSARIAGTSLDVDKCEMPVELSSRVIGKLDHLFAGLNHKIAQKNKISISNDPEAPVRHISDLEAVQERDDTTRVNQDTKLTYHDIIERACEMNEDMKDIYMKSLELYHDIPKQYRKQQFKLPKKVLKHFRYKHDRTPHLRAMCDTMKDKEYVPIKRLLNDASLNTEERTLLKTFQSNDVEHNLNKKSFLLIKYNQERWERSRNGCEDEDPAVKDTKNGPKQKQQQKGDLPPDISTLPIRKFTPYLDEDAEVDEDEYGIADCLVTLPRRHCNNNNSNNNNINGDNIPK
ncbi:Rrn9p KNAG_0J00340 [Huiozyma naganishii CBS 8797]|uniref:Rrn9 domain-containing protein n=1 Tax=Huiozyma naganishii (strain ATCC MYA-139 / BCRC 22969 / CBS 8797 / KCTC 17520 / NBRC 10181 / NCYC 3082 / Yp74L-3) TaxID=1071383 RepID=J7S2M5_HUIN7|nr:hypothetical protein KNAG_0J00340 [Kazachstania naganishii CBS 8797]CCK72117.1 hypothetical protein KNAG_0J00340 [Kazachstania naganishii CBS 8797]